MAPASSVQWGTTTREFVGPIVTLWSCEVPHEMLQPVHPASLSHYNIWSGIIVKKKKKQQKGLKDLTESKSSKFTLEIITGGISMSISELWPMWYELLTTQASRWYSKRIHDADWFLLGAIVLLSLSHTSCDFPDHRLWLKKLCCSQKPVLRRKQPVTETRQHKDEDMMPSLYA